jgi:hypothetical protein
MAGRVDDAQRRVRPERQQLAVAQAPVGHEAFVLPVAYCLPAVRHSRVVVSDGALRTLSRDEVAAVLAHLDTRPPITDDHGGRRIALPSELVDAAPQETSL